MKLLIVEDEVRIANSLKKGLEEEEFTVEIANDGEEGQKLARTKEYDCIVLDLMLPKISGLQILRTMRSRKVFTPVIILTAKGSTEEKVEGFGVGADDYLAKPFSFEELLARINALIRRSNLQSNIEFISIDNLTLDRKTQIVKRGEVEVHLSAREFKILEFLMLNQNAILNEERIINRVWEITTDISSNVVAAHIKNLRNKIDKAFPNEKQLIITVRGLGYRING